LVAASPGMPSPEAGLVGSVHAPLEIEPSAA